ncbi:diaminopropionate ammonia-lyase [Azospirillum halopraeferens]|uniref:diaminopropionate ammonia-lyase n=1 Tax=Azospirillum halopraeferens TaxID=34010 RepID=UPI00048F68FD|nr:diaminopropionate ammonia-lyase [Azospirillum halopraeferens]
MTLPTLHGLRLIANPAASPDALYGPRQCAILSPAGLAAARREIASWPGYAPTPLVALPGLAAAAGVADIRYKDESGRFGLGSFKALGGAYAVLRLLRSRPDRHPAEITVCCATDGNHGRSVAWGARQFGCRCVIFIHATVSEGRRAAIAAYGAEVIRTAGTYDDSVRAAAEAAARNGWHVVSDTSYDGYRDIPRDVMQGYTVMAEEALEQIPAPPTHVFVQGGVGGLAAAVCAQLWQRYGARRPVFVVAEPDRADCLFRSAAAGRRVAVPGDLNTLMAGLACGEVSELAWEILEPAAPFFTAIPDDAAVAVMRLLADGVDGDPPLVAGESAVAGLAVALAAAQDPPARAKLGLGPDARVLVFGTEGATDPDLYEELVGRPAASVAGAA